MKKDQASRLRDLLYSEGEKKGLSGLILVAQEGINGTIAGPEESVCEFRKLINSECGELEYKNSSCSKKPFKRYKVKLKDSIVDIGDPQLSPELNINKHLSAEQWEQAVNNEDCLLLDVRNNYESRLGKFRSAITPDIEKFNQFSEYLDQNDLPQDKKILMYCTGGIRCEKAIMEMQRRGFDNVYQLQGGILKYLEQFPNSSFEGECFVFDHRVAVDQNLAASKQYDLCPHCGDPGNLEIECGQCAKVGVVCTECSDKPGGRTCSKNCRYHYELRSSS